MAWWRNGEPAPGAGRHRRAVGISGLITLTERPARADKIQTLV